MRDEGDIARTNLVGVPPEAMADVLGEHVDRPFRSRQVARWIVDRNATAFSQMTDLSKELRDTLARHFVIADPEILETAASADGSLKWLFGLGDGLTIEGVSMPDGPKVTFCLSSQAGCSVGCTFCVTGALGAGRNLRPDEIVGQYRVMLRHLSTAVDRVNIVFMGMGEPLLNTGHLGTALETLYERVSPKRITVSTAGILPGIRWLAGLHRRPKLAVSLNAPDQERRERLMPIAKRYPLDVLMAALRRFPLERGRRITFEYVLIRDLNDQVADAGMVVDLVRGIPCKVNVIPLNEDPEHFPKLRRPDDDTINRFAVALRDAGTNVTVRWSKGLDVAAACGQLKGAARLKGVDE
jgi:23S rRNA (adenine2503-C2)-methyltransferase